MSDVHLNPERWQALLEGTLTPELVEPLKAHLAEDCEICEVAMAEAALQGDADRLDGEADEAILGVREAKGPAWPVDEVAGHRWMRPLSRRPRPMALAGAAVAMAASALLVLSIGQPDPTLETSHLKGGPLVTAALPQLALALVQTDGSLRPLEAETSLPRNGHLIIRFDSAEALCGALEIRSANRALISVAELCLEPGASTYTDGGEVVAIALEDPTLGETVEVNFTHPSGATATTSVRLSPSE